MSKNIDVCIILLNYNKSSYTIQCVESLLGLNLKSYLIVLIDNGSTYEDFNLLKSLKSNKVLLKRLHKNIGYVGGINYGLKISSEFKPAYYLVMNNDTLIDKHAAAELIKTAEKYDDNCIVSGKIYNMDEPDTLQYIGQWCKNHNELNYVPYIKGGREKDKGQYDKEIEMGMLDDMMWLVPSKVFNQVGYYCNYFFLYGEQNDYALRAKKMGFKLIYTPKAKIWHYHHLTTGKDEKSLQSIKYWRAYALLLIAYLHFRKIHFFQFYCKKNFIIVAKAIYLLIKNENLSSVKPLILATLYFNKWLLKKGPNNGFNPYLEK